MCKAWTGDSSTTFASGQVANQPNAQDRFRYHARKYGEQIGQQNYTDCVDFKLISAEYRNSFTPGATFQNYRNETRNVVAATFLPPNWESTPTPEEKGSKASKEAKRPAATPEAAVAAGKSPAALAAEERAVRATEREAEFQRKQAAYESGLAEQKRQVEEFERAEAEFARKKAEQQAKADAVMEAFRRQSDAHAELMRKHSEENTAYREKIARLATPQTTAKASTNDDPNTCVTRPEIRLNDGGRGNTFASVINGCPQKVDIIVCLKRTSGKWSCGATFGVLHQSKATYNLSDSTGETFVDAVTYGGDGKLKRPDGK